MQIYELSEQLLLQVKMGGSTKATGDQLETIPWGSFINYFQSDNRRKAFWINIYNAYFQILRQERQIGKPEIYRQQLIPIAGRLFSLDDIEHGILRKYRLRWALGYLPNPFAPAFIKQLALIEMDYRIHFALNCGAKSCPPIAFYTTGKIDQQLDQATASFLEGETQVIPEKKEVHITRLFQWFLGDFGGSRGIRNILKEKLGVTTTGMTLVFKTYNWDEQLDNFK